MEPKFKLGQVVKLKSGGPEMTISGLVKKRNMTANGRGFTDDFEGNYRCQWFVGDQLNEEVFQEDGLTE